MKRTERITVCITKEEQDVLRLRAEYLKTSISNYVRYKTMSSEPHGKCSKIPLKGRTEQLVFNVTPEEKNIIQQYAESCGANVSDYVRMQAIGRIGNHEIVIHRMKASEIRAKRGINNENEWI